MANPYRYENPDFIHTVREHSRGSTTQRHRNRKRYRRADARKQGQRGWE